ncbi:DUF3304 domain-containing protein [Pseudomonas sp. NPDC007930]|uniref:DUF3304 domain-containing protein n=1 Tax=Pseudomonas sp. NPDC007930 TaxID=3364417 RepID=UPI0036E5B13E
MSVKITVTQCLSTLSRGVVRIAAIVLVGSTSSAEEGPKVAFYYGDLRGVNHTAIGVNWFSYNGKRVTNIPPFGERGGSCCAAVHAKWRPGLKATIEWEVDPDPYPDIPMRKEGFGYEKEAWAAHVKNFERHHAVVDIPEYGEEVCGPTVHFLTCRTVKVTHSCFAHFSPNHPIQEPEKMEEPAVCP